MADEITKGVYAEKAQELRDRASEIKLQIDACDRQADEHADLAIKTFELSQDLRRQWDTADTAVKREILSILWLNSTLENVTLVPEWRKPFGMIAEGLKMEGSTPEGTAVELFYRGVTGLEPWVKAWLRRAA